MAKFVGSMLMLSAMYFSSVAVALTASQVQQRVLQPIIVNGQQAAGLMLFQNGMPETIPCAVPQRYSTADRAFSGWACYDVTTGTWLLNAQPPSQSITRNPYYPAPAPFYDYFGYSYPPDVYYPYSYFPYVPYGYSPNIP